MINFDIEPKVFNNFYTSLCGRLVSKIINSHILSLWQDIDDLKDVNVLAIGWPYPYIHHFKECAERIVIANSHIKPDNIDEISSGYKNITILSEINNLPFHEQFFDRIIVIHGAEFSTDTIEFLNNIEELLVSNGRIITIIPNSSGLWRKNKNTPFGYGISTSAGHLQWAFKHVGFEIDYYSSALNFPPTQSKHLLSIATKWEAIGRNILPFLSGIHIIEGHKNLFAGAISKPIKAREMLTSPKLKVVPE